MQTCDAVVAEIGRRRRERWLVCASDRGFWAWVAADAARLADLCEPAEAHVAATLRALTDSARAVSAWGVPAPLPPESHVPAIRHGTEAGYHQHRYAARKHGPGHPDATPCAECRAAHSAHTRTAKRVRAAAS